MKGDYQRYIERKLREAECVAVADTGYDETTYIWHTPDGYRMYRKRWRQNTGWRPVKKATAERRTEIIGNNNVAAVQLSDVPDPIAKRVRRAKQRSDERDDRRENARKQKWKADDEEERAVASLAEDMMADGGLPPVCQDIIDAMPEGQREPLSSIVSAVSQDREYVMWNLRELEEDGIVEEVDEKEAGQPMWRLVNPPESGGDTE